MTTANASDVMTDLNGLNNNGVSNDGGTITTNGSGNMTLPGVILSALLQSTVGITLNDGASTNGTTAGTVTKYAILIGQVKMYLFYFNGYRNSTATEQRITLDAAFTSRALFLTGQVVPTCSPWNGGAQQTSKAADADGLSSSGGSTAGYTGIHALDFGEITTAMDQLGCGVSQATTFTGCIFLVGV